MVPNIDNIKCLRCLHMPTILSVRIVTAVPGRTGVECFLFQPIVVLILIFAYLKTSVSNFRMENHEDIQKKLHYYISKLRTFLTTAKSTTPVLEVQDSDPSDKFYTNSLPSSVASPEIHESPAYTRDAVQLPGDTKDEPFSYPHNLPACDSELSFAVENRSPISTSLSPSEDVLSVLMGPSARKEFEAECKNHIPSYKLGHKSKRRTQSFTRFLERMEDSLLPCAPLPSCPPWVEAARVDGSLPAQWVQWAGKRPAPLSLTKFLAIFHGDQEISPDDKELCLMKNVNVAFYLTPTSKKSGRYRPSLIPSLSLTPSTREFRSQSQLLLEEIAACLHLQNADFSSPRPKANEKLGGKKRKSCSKHLDATDIPCFLSETSQEVYRRHYAARLYDEVHYLPPNEICFSLSNGKTSKKSSCHTGKDDSCTESFVLTMPSNIQRFIEWLNPGVYALFLIHWILLVSLKSLGKGKGLLFSKLIPRSFLNAAKSWTVSFRTHLRRYKVNSRKKHNDLTSAGALLAILPQSIPLIRQIFTCAALYREAEKLQMILSNLREHKLSNVAQHDAIHLLNAHEKDYKDFVLDKTHSRVSARIAAGKPLEGYKDTPSRYTDEDFAPALVHAVEARTNLHLLEKSFESTELSENTEGSGCPDLTMRVLNGLHGTCMAKADYRYCDISLGTLDSRVCTLQVVDCEGRNVFLDMKQGRCSREDDSWDAVDGATNNDYVNAVQSLYKRVDKYGLSCVVVRTDTHRKDNCGEIMRSSGERSQQGSPREFL